MPLVQSLAARAWGLMVAACAVVAGLGVVLSGTAHDHEGRTSWATVATVLAVALAAVGLAAWLAVRSVARRLGDLTAALEVVAAGDLHATVPVGRPDEIGAIAIAAGRSADRLRHTLTTVARSTAALDAGWRSVLETSNQMSDTAEGAAAMATAAAVSATLVSNNVQCVAAATEQLAGTTREVALHAAEASAVARSATDQAGHATSTVAALGESSQRVEHIVDIIRTVAAQTHLLALNATIEAARAGDAGLGFTVVAGEVKSLAAETSRATGQVSQSVTEIQAGSGEAGTAIAEISQIIERVSDNQTAIAAAVEEQTAATHEIGRGAAEAAVGSAAVAAHIARLVSDAKASAYAGAQCRTSASEIAEATLELEALIAGLDLTGPLDVAVGQDRVVARAHVLDGVTVVEDTVHGSGVHEFEYVGTWSHSLTNANAAADNDGSNSYSSMAGDVARLRFVGRQIRFLGVTDANHGVGAVAVDGGQETLVDQYSAVRGVAVDLWTSPLLPYGEHVFTLRVTGTMNADSRYVWTAVDRVEIV